MNVRELAGVAVLGLALGTGSHAHAAEAPVKIGVVMPLTGQAAYYGELAMQGINLAADTINANGGILGGRNIELVVEDGKCLPSETVAAGKKLISQDGVSAIVGALCSSASLALQELTGENAVVQVTGISTSPILTSAEKRHKYYFRTFYNSEILAQQYAQYVAKEAGVETFAFLAVNDDYGRGEVAGMEQHFEEIGTPEVVYKGYFEFQDTDFTSTLARIRSAGPDGVHMVARNPQNVQLLKQMQSIGYQPSFLSGDIGFSTPKTIEDAGEAIEDVHVPLAYVPGAMDYAGAEEFEKIFQAEHGRMPTSFTEAAGWTALSVAALGIDKAGTAEDSDKIAEAIQNLDWESPFGPINFDENGQNEIHVIVGKIEDGEVVVVSR